MKKNAAEMMPQGKGKNLFKIMPKIIQIKVKKLIYLMELMLLINW